MEVPVPSRRTFLKLSPAFPAGALTASLVVKADGQELQSFDLSVLKAQAGDIIVLTAPGPISQDTATRLRKCWDATFPTLQAMVMGDGLRVDGVLRPDENG
jgi:hypothetical protein